MSVSDDGTSSYMIDEHLGRYVDEFTFRLNDGDVKRHTLDPSRQHA